MSVDPMENLVVAPAQAGKSVTQKIKDAAKADKAGILIKWAEDGDSLTLRFPNWAGATMVLYHELFDQHIQTVCPKIVGKHCAYCDDPDKGETWQRANKMRTYHIFLAQAWVHEWKKFGLLAYANNQTTMIKALNTTYERYEKKQADTGKPYIEQFGRQDFIVTQQEQGKTRRFLVEPQPPDAPGDNPWTAEQLASAGGVWSEKKMIVMYIQERNPELLGGKPRYQSKNKPEPEDDVEETNGNGAVDTSDFSLSME